MRTLQYANINNTIAAMWIYQNPSQLHLKNTDFIAFSNPITIKDNYYARISRDDEYNTSQMSAKETNKWKQWLAYEGLYRLWGR